MIARDNGTAAFTVQDGGLITHGPDSDTIADTGDGNPATATLTPTSSVVLITCNDAHTCDITMGETGIVSGSVVDIVNISSNTVDFVDSAGVSELAVQ